MAPSTTTFSENTAQPVEPNERESVGTRISNFRSVTVDDEDRSSIGLALALVEESPATVNNDDDIDAHIGWTYKEHLDEYIASITLDGITGSDREAVIAALEEELAMYEDAEDGIEYQRYAETESYEELLRIGEQLGNVKNDRWKTIARDNIDRLPLFEYFFGPKASAYRGGGAKKSQTPPAGQVRSQQCDVCMICQSNFENGDLLRGLPCNHCFHVGCAETWLVEQNSCPCCRQAITDL